MSVGGKVMQQKPEVMIHNRIMQEIAETAQHHPGVYLPKKDKILEWTLYHVLQQLQEISTAVRSMEIQSRLKF
jgi:hypothetical protein